MGPDLWELYEYGEAQDEVAAIIRLAHFGALPPGVRVITQFEEIITVRLNRGDIPKISGAPETAGMSSGDTYFGADLELDAVDSEGLPANSAIATDQRRPDELAMTGRGIVIGVVDWGFDIRHPDFRKSDGSTRILALWDQRGGKQPGSPEPFGYGVVHTREAINKALATEDPYAALHYHPADADSGIGCHGTHVASIAAGSGGEGRPSGIAPEADLVLVHNAPWDALERGKLGDSVTLLEGIDFIARTAAGQPWVVNLSMGRHGEQHDGTTLIEQGLDAAVRAAAGRAICLSAGNYYNKRAHASGQLRPTQQRSVAWVINEKMGSDYNQLEVWYSWQDRFEVSVRSPDGSVVAQARLGEKVKLLSGGKEIGNLYHRAQEPNTLDHHITVYLYKTAPAGEWTITLTGVDVIYGHYHAWIEREVSCPRCQSHFRDEDADPTSTTGTICNGRRTIAVGAYDAHDPGHRIGSFSSVGPTRDGRLKPDLCAPGVSVLAARSAQREHPADSPVCTRMSGTSMAAPHVAGAIALAFQAAVRPLRIEETHNLLLGSARRHTVDDRDQDRVGIGMLDVLAFVERAGNVSRRTFVAVPEKQGATPAPPAPARVMEALDVELATSGALLPDVLPSEIIEGEFIDAESVAGGRIKRAAALSSAPTLIESTVMELETVNENDAPDSTPDSTQESLDTWEIEAIPGEFEYLNSLGNAELTEYETSDSALLAEELPQPQSPPQAPAAPACRVIDQFPQNAPDIQPAHRSTLAQVAHEIHAGRITAVSVVGHASVEGTDTRNEALGRQRAENAAAALRTLLDQAQPGASKSVTFTVTSRGEREPMAADHPRNRRVQVCLTPPGPVPIPADVEGRLRRLLGASMVLAGNPNAAFARAALPAAATATGSLWQFRLGFGRGGTLEAHEVKCKIEHHPGHLVPAAVLDDIVWEDPTIRLTAGTVTLPLRQNYLLGSFHSTAGRIASSTHPTWRLQSDHDIGTAVVFGFDLGSGTPAPLRRLDEFGRSPAAGRGPRVLVVCELVACKGLADYQPVPVVDAARLYPIAEILTDADGAELQMTIAMRRPDRSAFDHAWHLNGRHCTGLFTDRNTDQGIVALATQFKTGNASPIPTWENMFDYFDRNAARAAIRATVVNPAFTAERGNIVNRRKLMRNTGDHVLSRVLKVARQGEFDNVHIAPQMQVSLPPVNLPIPTPVGKVEVKAFAGFGPLGVSMAPLCAHDCFHMHWRWGQGYTSTQSLGWGSRGPYTEAGAPMVAPNQKIDIEVPANQAGIRYRATALRQRGGDWAVVMPHGTAYVLSLSVDPIKVLRGVAEALPGPASKVGEMIVNAVASRQDQAWAWIYFFLQYWPTMRAPHFTEVVEFLDLNALRRL